MMRQKMSLDNFNEALKNLILVILLSPFVSVSLYANDEELEGIQVLEGVELNEIRGGYAGFYLNVDYSGNLINTTAVPLDQAAEEGTPPLEGGTVAEVNGQKVKITAQVGELDDIAGIVQIVQVPGSNNVVSTVMNVEMTIINVLSDQAAADVSKILNDLYGAP